MAKRMIIVVFLILLAIGVTIAIPTVQAHADEPETATEETTEAEELANADENDTEEWLKEELLPKAASTVLLAIAMFISMRPQMINNSALARQMISYANTMGANKEATEKHIAEILGKYESLKERFDTAVELIDKYNGYIERLVSINMKLLEAVSLGFGNNSELVKKGTAEQICKMFEEMKEKYLSEVKGNDEEAA